jgi:hypothetical protein
VWIILKWGLERQNRVVWTGLIWLRMGTGGGLMWTWWWTSGFHKMLGSSRAAAQLAASQEGLSSMSEWVSVTISTYTWLTVELSPYPSCRAPQGPWGRSVLLSVYLRGSGAHKQLDRGFYLQIREEKLLMLQIYTEIWLRRI